MLLIVRITLNATLRPDMLRKHRNYMHTDKTNNKYRKQMLSTFHPNNIRTE